MLGRRRKQPPGSPAPTAQPDLDLIHDNTAEPYLTWLGHASFLGSLGGRRFVIDGVFSAHAGWLYRRYLPPALGVDQLPQLDAVVVTHNHYDHLDSSFIRALPRETPVIVPAGMGPWMRRHGREPVIELEWWQSRELHDLRVTLVPSRHWSRRGVFDTNRVLWGGFVVEGGGFSVYHSGDTAWFDGFKEIGLRFPKLEAAMLPVGGYLPSWFMEHYHLNPEQAGRAFVDLNARRFVPMHWGTFQLTDEPLSEPVDRIRSWWRKDRPGSSRTLHVLDVGETLKLDAHE